VSDALDVLISRYLDGAASRDDARRLDERLRQDPEARRALFLAAAQDTLLKEFLATEAAAKGEPSRRLRRWVVPAIAAAAAVLLAVAGLMLLTDRYPIPKASGSYRVAGGGQVKRGSAITTEAGPATIMLGGYCRVELQPGSTLRIEGRKRAEQVFLERGEVLCEVHRRVGTFVVRSALGRVSVTGTRFTVRIIEERGGEQMFGRRMVVRVLVGTVLVSGAWSRTSLRAGEETGVPRPETVLRKILSRLELTDGERRRLGRMLSTRRVGELRAAYRVEVRRRLFDAARQKLQTTMPKVMPTKLQPKVQAIRKKLRAGPPSEADRARIRLAMQKRTRNIMMNVLHKTADQLADEAAKDDRLVAWLLAKKIRAKMPAEKIAAFDAALKDAGISDREPHYVARAEAAIAAAMKAYDPDITGIVDSKTGKVIVSDAELGVPLRDEAFGNRVAKMLREILAGLELPKRKMDAIGRMLTGEKIEAERASYWMAARAPLFDAAHKKLQTTMPQKMPSKVQAKVMAIRKRLRAGAPPSEADRARIERAVMKRTRRIMMQTLHDTADALAVEAMKDERLVAASLAKKIRKKLSADKAAAFDAALKKAGITQDLSGYLSQAEQRIESAIDAYDPDLTGIVDPKTGKVVVEDKGL